MSTIGFLRHSFEIWRERAVRNRVDLWRQTPLIRANDCLGVNSLAKRAQSASDDVGGLGFSFTLTGIFIWNLSVASPSLRTLTVEILCLLFTVRGRVDYFFGTKINLVFLAFLCVEFDIDKKEIMTNELPCH